MRQPDIDGLLEKVDSRYTLVVTAARRARQLIDGDRERVDAGGHKPISVALREIAADEVTWSREQVAAAETAGESDDTEVEADAQPTVDGPALAGDDAGGSEHASVDAEAVTEAETETDVATETETEARTAADA